MKGLTISLVILILVGGAFGLMRLRSHRANLEKELAALQRQQRILPAAQQENERLRTVSAQTPRTDSAAIGGRQQVVERLRREVSELELRAHTRREDLKMSHAAETSALTINRDPELGMTRLEHFRNVGRERPRAAFQTLVWAAMKGDDRVLATALTMSDSARQKADALLGRLPEDARKKYPTAESLAAIAVAEEMLKGGALELPGETFTDATHAVIQIRTQNKEATLPMQLGAGGWQFVVPERAIDGIARRLAGGDPDATK
jgi:hypothetical protein